MSPVRAPEAEKRPLAPGELYYNDHAKSMGKRELLLIVGFIVAGVIVYQATAPPPEPGSRGFSISHIVESLRREVRGNRASAEVTRPTTHPVPATVTELRITGGFPDITITGEQRDDIALEMRIVSNGYDEAEARRWAEAAQLHVDTTASSVAFRTSYPDQGRQRGYFTLKVPSRLAVRIDQTSNRAAITNVATLEMLAARGETAIKRVRGRVVLSHMGGKLVIDDVGSLKLTARRSDTMLNNIRGDATLDLQNSELAASAITGPISVETRSSELTFNKLEEARGAVRVNAVGGTLALHGLTTEARIDGRNTEIDVDLAKPVAVTIYNDGEEPIDVTPPASGYTVDALATFGRISVPQGTVRVAEGENEQRANGAVKGGGPAITLRANRGNISIRAK